jgi:hypothetical protein
MITEKTILEKIAACFVSAKDLTTFLAVVDPDVWQTAQPELDLPTDKNLIWSEPLDGVYLINLSLMVMFKTKLNNVTELFQEIVDCNLKIDSKRFDLPKKQILFEPQFQSTSPSIAIVTMFSPKGFINYWEQFLVDADLPENISIDIVLGDNSGTTIFKSWFELFYPRAKAKYREAYRIDLGAPHRLEDDTHYLETNKHAHVARSYSKFLYDIVNHYDYILKIEDDMEPPTDALVRLYGHMKNFERNRKKVAAVAGCYPQKFDPSTICVSMQPEIWGKIPKVKDVQPRLFRVEMQGGGFTLYNAKAIKEVLPYRLVFKKPHGNYYMTGWDGYIGEEWSNTGWEQHADGSIMCNHHF